MAKKNTSPPAPSPAVAKRKMLQFVDTPRDMPAKRDAEVRNEDYWRFTGTTSAKKPKNRLHAVVNAEFPSARTTAPSIIISQIG